MFPEWLVVHQAQSMLIVCFKWAFLGETEQPPSYYVGNIKGSVGTRAEAQILGVW